MFMDETDICVLIVVGPQSEESLQVFSSVRDIRPACMPTLAFPIIIANAKIENVGVGFKSFKNDIIFYSTYSILLVLLYHILFHSIIIILIYRVYL